MATSSSHQFQLRIPLDLHEMLVAAAGQNERSLHREIVFRLRRSFVGEVASARTRERAGAVEEVIDEGSPHAEPYDVPADPEPRVLPSLPNAERIARHERCRKRAMHHIYHGGKPCPECGYPG